jgi:transcriptional regulator with XRE-family HTH domain
VTSTEDLLPTLAETLLLKRLAAKLSQQQVADATGIPRSGVSDVERGLREVSALELKAFAVLYGTTTDALLGIESAAPSIHTPEGLVVRLEKVTENLYGYLSDRARELAEPHIQVAEEAAAQRAQEARRHAQRLEDLVAELRIQLDHALRDAAFARHKAFLHHDKSFCRECKNDTTKEQTT